MKSEYQALEVWGDLACFSRPELKVERFSYPVPTPSAVRGIYDAIYCKPREFRWQVKKIEILYPKEHPPDYVYPSYIALRRNEVTDKAKVDTPKPIAADDPDKRTQRQTMALKNVRYRFHAEIWPWPEFESRLHGMVEQFRRRAANGKCIYQPYFGCREFPAFFELVEVDAPISEIYPLDMDIGWMLYDVFDLSKQNPILDTSDKTILPPPISFFQAKVEKGVIDKIPDYNDPAVKKPPRSEDDY
jgi:CRISPR-associated protein Cas5d